LIRTKEILNVSVAIKHDIGHPAECTILSLDLKVEKIPHLD